MLVVNIGCGANKFPSAVGIDIQRKYHHVNTILTAVPDVIATFKTPFLDSSVSMVVMREFVEHVDCMALLQEAKRILKPEGKVLIETPNAMCLFRLIRALRSQELNPSPDHIHVFSNAEISNLLRRNGVCNIKVSYINKIHGSRYGRIKNTLMLVVMKLFPHLSFNLRVTAVNSTH